MNKVEVLTCESCGNELNEDSRFNIEALRSGIKKRLFRCLNGHSLLVEPPTPTLNSVKLEDDLAPRIIDRNRSVLCDVCRRRIYNAHANQKRHRGYCQQQHQIKKYKEDKKLQQLIGPEGKKALKKKNSPKQEVKNVSK